MTEAGSMNADNHSEEQPEENSLSRTNEFQPKGFSAFIGGFSNEQLKEIQKTIGSTLAPSVNSMIQSRITESTWRSIAPTVAPSINSVAQKCASLFASTFDGLAIRSDLLAEIDLSSFEFSSETWEKFSEAAQHAIRDIETEGEKTRRGASPDFANNPDACERFVEWFETSPSTKGKSGKPTITALAKLLGISHNTACKCIKHPEKITNNIAVRLRNVIGEQAYIDMAQGEGAYQRQIKEREKAAALARLESFFETLEPETAVHVVEAFFAIVQKIKNEA